MSPVTQVALRKYDKFYNGFDLFITRSRIGPLQLSFSKQSNKPKLRIIKQKILRPLKHRTVNTRSENNGQL